uniref:Dystonin n=1 Tax=Callorhinchus milii TaxID=7868 RepID=A0A4W3JSC6_CALMI
MTSPLLFYILNGVYFLQVRKHVNDLYEDLRDGHNLISLLEALSGDTLPREKGRMRFHRLQNVQIALDYLKRRQVKLVNIRNDDITDGNPKLTLGLIWTIILHFQISDIHVTGESEDMSAKERLLLWSQQMTEGYTGIRCENFTSCWRDGRLFNAIIHKYRPDLIDMSQVTVQSNLSNLEHAFGVAEKLGVTRLLDPEDVNVPSPDEKSVITYVSSLYDVFPKIPEGGEGISANDVDVKWIEYQNMVNYLVQWIKHHVTVMSDRSFSNNPAELKALYNQYIQFKDTEIPPKERDKAKIKCLYKLMEVWIEFGRIKLPQGYHPNDVEKEWGKLIIAMLEREKLLRPEVERLEMLQQIATRVQHDSIACEDKLTLAHNSLQLDAKRLDSGLQFQNETEIAGYLLESENLIRQQIIDVQTLIDGKYYQADQLVQRVAKLRDDLMLLKSECSSVYSQGRSMSAEQTKLMMAGLTQSLNQSFSSGFSRSLTPTFNSSSSLSLTPSLTRSFAPILPPSLPVSLSSGLKPVMMHGFISGFVPGVDPDTRQTIKLMQIRKPMMRSQLANQSLTEDEINMKFVQDLLSWVEEMQVQLDQAEWGSDMPSVESHLENHRNVHRAIEEFESSIKEAESAENQITSPLKNAYSEKLRMLESHYSKLLTTSRHRATHLESLRSFISRATKELIWLNEKEEEEVAYDWSDRNSSMLRKREYHSELMRELEDKDMLMRSVQDDADQLLLDHHPARLTIEAFKAAMQTQWSWVLQLCHCVEQHLRENAAYFEFYNDAKESLDYLKNLQETIKRKYSCDKTSSLVRLEDLLQDSMDEKEQLLQYRSNVAGLMSRAKAVVQLKPRNPDNPLRISIPIKAICDYKQIEITIYKEDECVLENNSHRAKWKVVSPTGNEAMVPSVCFTIPPPNKEAIERTSRIEQLYQNVLALWHQSHIDMKSIISWHLLMTEISTIRAWNASSIKTMLPGEHQQVLGNLQDHYDTFLEDSQESDAFTITDRTQLEREVNFCKQYYEDLLKSAEREEQEESACNLFISEVRNIRLRVENCEERLIRQIRTPLERDDLQESVQRISEQEKLKSELEELIVDLEKVTEKCDQFFGQTCSSSSPTLRTELNVVLQNLNQVYSLSSIHLDKLKTVNLIVKNTQGAEALVKLYETKLGEEEAVPPDTEAIEFLQNTLKQWRSEVDERREVFHTLEDELQKGKAISERMLRVHNERDMDVDWHKEKAVQLAERWENVRCQIDNRLHDLDSISMSLNSYRECYKELDLWIQEMEITQQKMQESQPEDIRALAEELNQQKTLASEVEMKQQKMDTCQKYSEQYSSTVKEYELHLMTYKAMVDSQQKSPVKRRRMQSSSDVIIQEFMDLRTRYTALVTLMTQYVKFASDALKRSEEEEVRLVWGTTHLDAQSLIVGESCKLPQVAGCQISEEDRRHTEQQLGSLQESYDQLCEESSDLLQQSQTALAEEAVQKVIIHQVKQPSGPGSTLTLILSLKYRLVDEKIFSLLRELSLAVERISDPLYLSGIAHPAVAAFEQRVISETSVVKILEIQLATGGLRAPATDERLDLEEAFQRDFIIAPLYFKLLERQRMCKELIDPNAAEKLSLMELMERTREVMIRLLGAQLFAGGIVDSTSCILSRQVQTGGVVNPVTGNRLTLDEAVQCNLITSSSALLVLEAQKVFMGLIWPESGEIFSVDASLQQGVVTSELAHKILYNRQKVAALYIPEDSSVLSLEEASRLGVIDDATAQILGTAFIPDLLPITEEPHSTQGDVPRWVTSCEIQICTTDSQNTHGPETVPPLQTETKQRFVSYLMMHSYMDAGTGKRLLLVDGDLDENIKMVIEANVDVSSDFLVQGESGFDNCLDWPRVVSIQESNEMDSYLETLDLGRKGGEPCDVLNEGSGNVTDETMLWIPGDEHLENYDPREPEWPVDTRDRGIYPIFGVVDFDVCRDKTVTMIDTLDDIADPLEVLCLNGHASAKQAMNVDITLSSENGYIDCFESCLDNQMEETEKTEDDITHRCVQKQTASQTRDLNVGGNKDIVLPKEGKRDSVTDKAVQWRPLDQPYQINEDWKLTPCPLETELCGVANAANGKELDNLSFDGSSAVQRDVDESIGTATAADIYFQDTLANQVECSMGSAEGDVHLFKGISREPDIPTPSEEHLNQATDETAHWIPINSQLSVDEDEQFVLCPLEPMSPTAAASASDKNAECGKNKIRTVKTLEDIADAEEMPPFVGGPVVDGELEETIKQNITPNVEVAELELRDGKGGHTHSDSSGAILEGGLDAMNATNKLDFDEFVEANAESDGTEEDVFMLVTSAAEQTNTRTHWISADQPLEADECGELILCQWESEKPSVSTTAEQKVRKDRTIRKIGTLDDIAELEDPVDVFGESVKDILTQKDQVDWNTGALRSEMKQTNAPEGAIIDKVTEKATEDFEYGRGTMTTTVGQLGDVSKTQEMSYFNAWKASAGNGNKTFLQQTVNSLDDVFETSIPTPGNPGVSLNDLGFISTPEQMDEDFERLKGKIFADQKEQLEENDKHACDRQSCCSVEQALKSHSSDTLITKDTSGDVSWQLQVTPSGGGMTWKDAEDSHIAEDLKEEYHFTAFDIQDFISEHAADLSPQESRQLLKLLNSTQTAFRVVMEKSSAQSEALSLQLQMRLELDDQKAFEEQQQECNEQLQKMSNWLKQTENRIMGYAVGSVATDNLGHLQQYQAEGRALQKEIQANAATLANVIKVTERFLEESGVKLQPEQRAEIEKKLEEAKSKFSLLSEQTESNLKELEKAVTAAVKQETEKVAAVEQLEENKSKIEGLLGWLSDIGKEQLAEHNGKKALQQNGNEIPAGGLGKLENEDSMNGNMPHDQTETGRDEVDQPTTDGNLTQQYQKAKARHQKVLSRQQSYIISTQSVQDFLNKKGHNMLPAERERLERNLSELKVQYEAALTHSERRVRLIQTVQDELQKFSADHGEFENWLHQSESELGELQCPAPDLDTLSGKLQRQKSFSEDVISHKGDLRYITISGQRVLDAAKSCSRSDHGKETKDDVSAACLAVQSKLKVSSERFKSLHSKCNLLGKNLKDVVEQYSHYQDISSGLLPWLQTSEDAAEKNLTEPIAADPQNLQKQLEEAKTLQVQISGHQTAVEKLRKAVDALMATDGDLLLNRMEIHDNVDDVVQRYDNLSKSVNDRNERLQMTLTRSLSVQDGLDEMLDWMASVEKSLEDQQVVPLNSAAIQEALSKNAALEQSISSRQTSISAIKEKVNCFIETADPSTASALQAKMEQLTKRFTAASDRHRARTETLEKLGSKVELFETTCKKLEQFVAKKSQAVTEVDGMGKELTQYMQGMLEEWSSKASEVEEVTRKGSELSNLINALSSPAKSRAEVKSELMAIQQDTTDVNHQYEEVGGSLRQMESQLQSTLTQIQQVREETETLEKWLDNMGKTAAAWDTLPTETEAIKEQVEQQKAFEAELKEKTGKMEQLKEKLTHLLQKTPDSPEAAKWKQMLDCINSKWKGVSQSAADRQQKLEESSSFLTQFQATEAQLNQWLLEKELMMNVLGPLSIDPNMLNTQKQQVQILLKEFDTRKTQHEQLKRAAEGILNRPGEMPPACSVVSDQLASVTRKWDNLTGQLVSRSDRIDQAIVKSTEYQGLVRDLSSKLSSLEGRLASQAPLSAQPEAVKQQLEVASEIRSELEREEKHMQQAQGLSEELSELVGEQYLKAELSRQLDNVLKPFRDLQERAGNRVHQLQFALVSSQQFQQMFDDFQAWLAGKCTEHGQMPPVSAKHDKLKALIEEQTEFQKSLVQQAGSYEMIIAEGESLLQNTQPGPEKTALQGQLATLKTNWEELSKQAEDRQEKLKHSSQKAQKYRECVENLLPWIEECEAKVSQIQVGSDARQIELSLENVKALQSDVDQHRRTLEAFNVAADGLVESSQADVEEVRGQKTSVNRKVERLSEHLRLGKERAQEMGKRVKDLQGSLQETKKQLNGARQQLVLHDALGPQALSSKHLSNMNAQRRTLQALRSQVDNVRSLARGLAAEVPDGSGTSELLQMTESLQQDYSSVTQQLQERCSFLEKKLQGISRFQNNIREMFSLFADLDDELDSMAPVGRDLQCLSSQKEGISEFILKLQGLMSDIERASVESKQMLESASSPDLLGLKRDLDALRKQCNKLLDRATVRQEQVESTLARVQEFCAKIKNLGELLTIAENHEEQQGCVGMETDVINQQVESFKVFQKEEIDPLQAKFQEVNWLGQGLIQSVAKNTNIQNLEHDLEESNTRWNTLTKKVAERAAQLQEALLHCGRFQDALESLLSWLMDTEELVTNQKPPSAEFKVVKAQIQEQKLLQHLLDDRKSTVEIIKREGEKIAELADAADKDKILKQINGLSRRWNALLTKADTRHRQLEGTLVVAQQFHDTVEPLNEWLTATEKKVANSEPIGTQTGKLQQQITQHKALEDDIISHNKQLHQAISVGQSLKTMSSRDDKDLVQEKLDTAQTRYIELQERCGRKAALIQQALSNARIFGEEEVELLNWLAEVHDKLNNVSVQDYDPDVLQKQLSEHLALHEDIVVRKQHVDQAVKNGLALLKQTTGDEVIIIQERLDEIKARYAEITTTSGKVLKTLEQALQLATKFKSAHEVLAAWLEQVEAELATYTSVVLVGEQRAQAHQRHKVKVGRDQSSLDTVNEVSSALLELVPWRAREGLDKLVSDDNERYRLASDTVGQKVEEIDAAIQRSQQFDQAADAEIAWIIKTEKKLKSFGDIRLEQDQTTGELQIQKAFSMDILRHKDTIDELVANGDTIMNSCSEEEKESLKVQEIILQKQYEVISQMNSERYLQLERAQSLVSQFWETYEELWPWLQETLTFISQLPTPAIEFETLKQQQEELRQLRELIAEHKPHIDKMNKTGPQLLELSPREGLAIQSKYTAADKLYSQIKEDVKQRAVSLDEAISQSTQFHDKIDPMLESLERIVERLRQPPPVSAEVEKIKEQINENKNVSVELEKLQPAFETLKRRGEELIGRSDGADKDICAKAVQDQLDKMIFYWDDIKTRAEEREAKLLDVMDMAEKFWCDHSALIVTIKDSQDLIRELEEPGIDPSVVKEQQESLEAIKEEVDGLQEELEIVQNLGAELTVACGEPDKPIVRKNIDEVATWDNLNKAWKDRIDRLNEAMLDAVQFQDALQAMFDWIDIAETKLNKMSPVGTDLETVKLQIHELKHFKTEAYQQQIEMERLNHQGELLLKKVTEEEDKCVVQEPLHELKHFWENLDEKIVNRQHKLEGALLALGQFQHALDELLAWLTHTEELLNEQKAVGGDPKAIEIGIAKHHVLKNDVLAHTSTVEAVNKAGNDLIESNAGEEASSLRSKLDSLNQRWKSVLEQTVQRQQQLRKALIEAQGFHNEIEDMQHWLTETERHLTASKPVGGLPETAREQVNAHVELCAAFKTKEEIYTNLIDKGRLSCEEIADSSVEQDMNHLKERWESVEAKLNERKVKLEEALNLAMEFHNSLQDFINWLTQAEQTLTLASPPSLIMDTVLFQVDEHKVFANEVNSHREQIIELDKTGTHLKYFSQKQDVVLIKNLLISVQNRWEKVVQRSVDRGRALDDARKRAKQFQEAWKKLMEWLEDSERNLDSDLEIANDPDKVKMQLSHHKEFQKALGAKHSVYDTTIRTGRSLKEKSTLADDHQKLDDMLSELRDKWDTVCGKSVERQNKLEEALLFSGQFTDALQALIDWLYKIEPMLAEDQPVHGDLDLVMNLIDAHKVFQKELGKRTSSVQALKRSARELAESSRDDSSWVKVQMQELSTRWETVCALSVSKQVRLEQALNQSEEFRTAVHVLLEWLAEAEQALRFHGILPEDDEALRALIDQHKEFVRKLEENRMGLNVAVGMGEAILAICHPDSITTIKHWITIIRARFEEVTAWAKQHQLRLEAALAGVIANQELLENLLGWLQWAETILTKRDQEPIPQEIDEVKALIAEHQVITTVGRPQGALDKIRRGKIRSVCVCVCVKVLLKSWCGFPAGKRSPMQAMYSPTGQTIESKNPRANLLVSKWQQVWLLALDRRRKLNDALDRLEELREFANFDFDVWRKRYMRWMNHKKSRVMDFFRRIDKDQDGKITRQEFIDGILSSKFPTSRLEMSAVADIFDRDGDGYIDYYEFVAALHPNKDAYKPLTDADKIEDEVTRQVAKCKCAKRFQVEQIGDNKYRFFLGNQFGDSQQLRLVRILRSTVMVRVGGGWMALDEFLVKNDPCRAKGRTNVELREKFMVPEGTTCQSVAAFRPRGRRSRPSSRAASPNRSTSSATQSVSVPPNTTPQHIIRNYDKPWLTNSKTSTPVKSPDSPECRVPSPEVTPIQGSKLRPPGYLSGKSFHSGEESSAVSVPPSRGRSQATDARKASSRPASRAGSKTGSRASSRRGSDASDFDISDIQSVCSDASETVPDGATRSGSRAGSRASSGRASKIPTPSKRSPAPSKLSSSSKR